MPQPLTDAIEALTTYANTVTGASDTTLSDAVATLAAGYGQSGGSYGDFSAGNIKALIFHGTEYIQTDYLGALANLFAVKVESTAKTTYEYFFSCANGTKRTAVQRNSNGSSTFNHVCNTGGGGNFGSYTITQDQENIFVVMGFQTNDATVATLPLLIGAGYYSGSMESIRTKMYFYGLNIMDRNGDYIARFMPWLENSTPCVKDLVTGNIFYNAGTGTFGYIDADGNIH